MNETAVINDLGWWLLWACAVPLVTVVLCMVALAPRVRRHDRFLSRPLTVTAIRVHPPAAELDSRLEIDP